jgi:hypothetical protein
MGLILLIILVPLLFGGLGGPYIGAPWGPGYGLGHGGTGILGVVLIVILILVVTGRL